MPKTTTVRRLAPEDILPGSFVVVLSTTDEFIMRSCEFGGGLRVERLVTTNGSPVPYEVLSVCLPLVLARGPDGAGALLDVRRQHLGCLGTPFGREAIKRLSAAKSGRGDRAL